MLSLNIYKKKNFGLLCEVKLCPAGVKKVFKKSCAALN